MILSEDSMHNIKISIIVPAYNVESYLKDCLDSLVGQSIIDVMEIIMINDGSTDMTGLIMEEYAQSYNNFHVYHKENGGLGKARNYGVGIAKGEYIAFVDSDDFVSEEGYEKMLFLAKENNTDIVIGNVVRFNSAKMNQSTIHQRVCFKNQNNIHVFEFPELVYDTIACNKLIKKSFWKQNNLLFPEAMLYEDIPVIIPAYILANSVSIMEETLYYWRIREDGGKSITQQVNETRNFIDRMKAIKMVYDFFSTHEVPHELKKEFDYKVLSHDFKLYINNFPDCNELYQATVVESMQPVVNKMDKTVFQGLSFLDRLRYKYVKKKSIKKLRWLQKITRMKYNFTQIVIAQIPEK